MAEELNAEVIARGLTRTYPSAHAPLQEWQGNRDHSPALVKEATIGSSDRGDDNNEIQGSARQTIAHTASKKGRRGGGGAPARERSSICLPRCMYKAAITNASRKRWMTSAPSVPGRTSYAEIAAAWEDGWVLVGLGFHFFIFPLSSVPSALLRTLFFLQSMNAAVLLKPHARIYKT
jgi:hypothetical protein